VTLGIIAVTALAWAVVALSGLGDLAAVWGGFIPARADGSVDTAGAALAPMLLTPLTATLLHAGIVHLGFNLLILAFCGRSVENILGPVGLVILYLLGAYVAAVGYYAQSPGGLEPMIGASGAISAVIGAYAMLFGRNRVKVADPRLALWLNALWLAAAWVGLQLLVGFTFQGAGARIAFGAHIGGFVVGLVLAKPLLLLRYRGA
jgi:membrane associated rhomboid family serine protease